MLLNKAKDSSALPKSTLSIETVKVVVKNSDGGGGRGEAGIGKRERIQRHRERERDRVVELRNKNTTKGSDFFRAYTRPGK